MRIVIMGCGRVGSLLAAQLYREGHEVGIIDMSQKSFRRLPDDFRGLAVIGTGIDEDVLRAAGIEGADAFVAVTEGDNRNIMAAQVAREIFGVPQVVARIYDPGREAIYRELGIDTVCPTTVVCSLIQDRLVSRFARRA
jgi:trk system potassium uptake protein